MNLFVVSPHRPGNAHRLVDLKQKGLFLTDSEELQSVCSRLEQKTALHSVFPFLRMRNRLLVL